MTPEGPPKSKAVSADPMNSLRAHLAQQRAGIREEPKVKKGLRLKGGLIIKSNKGIEGRLEADATALPTTKHDTESYKAKLEHKADIYDRLGRGMTGGFTEKERAELALDVDRKVEERSDSSEEESGNDSQSVSSDGMTDIEDEYGRMRRVKRSEERRRYRDREMPIDSVDVIRGPGMHHNPVYKPDEDRIAKIREAAKETPLEVHWDPKGDNRQKGAGWMDLGEDGKRVKNLAELGDTRKETVRIRQETGADTGGATSVIAMASLKRKERNGERVEKMDAKRRKVDAAKDAMDFLADMEVELTQQG